ncbi:hypothetical protein PVAP13_5KG198056 [Panicum virgatum]|uniref:Uncharacterized protein n=1 Tax=Panicum virgatum TaxID=38727 RepID=A0A8T0SFY2_PANVG|nr:hypothetical protein PVAP13_5KG198056 [Panicum virgatum]
MSGGAGRCPKPEAEQQTRTRRPARPAAGMQETGSRGSAAPAAAPASPPPAGERRPRQQFPLPPPPARETHIRGMGRWIRRTVTGCRPDTRGRRRPRVGRRAGWERGGKGRERPRHGGRLRHRRWPPPPGSCGGQGKSPSSRPGERGGEPQMKFIILILIFISD